MQIRSPRTALAVSTALALTVAALAPTAAFAKGPGPGPGGCDADCPNAQTQAQQVRARDGSAQTSQTRARAGGGQQVQARAGRDAAQETQTRARAAMGTQAGFGPAQRGRPDDTPRGPEACEECQFEMGELTEEEAATLVFMANEEKLAHDVYVALGELYDLPVFDRIAQAEAQHQAAVNAILARYDIEDTAYALPAGEFSDPDIAALYTSLVERGSQTLAEALAVGAFIEEDDVAALEAAMTGLEESAPDVHNMYSNLLEGSQRHLEAFGRFA